MKPGIVALVYSLTLSNALGSIGSHFVIKTVLAADWNSCCPNQKFAKSFNAFVILKIANCQKIYANFLFHRRRSGNSDQTERNKKSNYQSKPPPARPPVEAISEAPPFPGLGDPRDKKMNFELKKRME